MHDLLIRGGQVYDGSGGEPRTADIAVSDDLIVDVNPSINATARRTIDADGAIVTPAWVDIHTHYDGQVTWDSEMNPSASHGVGTIVMGNCGVGFAPVAKGGEQDLIELMEGVEDIPGTALHEGMPWGAWQSYPEYLDFLAERKYALNISSLVAHGAVRNYVRENGVVPTRQRPEAIWSGCVRSSKKRFAPVPSVFQRPEFSATGRFRVNRYPVRLPTTTRS